jgi:hypothetical protein
MAKQARERFKDRNKPRDEPGAKPSSTVEAVKRRRNRRFIVVGLIGLSFPILEVIAYQFRTITITINNRSDRPLTDLKVIYAGGSFDAAELKPGGSVSRVIRPDFTFRGAKFATYPLDIQFRAANGIIRQSGRIGTIDFSAHETFTIETTPLEVPIQAKHTTSPGFPLSLIRDLLERLGIG